MVFFTASKSDRPFQRYGLLNMPHQQVWIRAYMQWMVNQFTTLIMQTFQRHKSIILHLVIVQDTRKMVFFTASKSDSRFQRYGLLNMPHHAAASVVDRQVRTCDISNILHAVQWGTIYIHISYCTTPHWANANLTWSEWETYWRSQIKNCPTCIYYISFRSNQNL